MENQFWPTSEIQANDKVNVLGIVWDIKSDYLVFSLRICLKALTILFQQNATIWVSLLFYDPNGLIQPVIIKSKLLFQDVCVTHADWNSKISGLLKDKFDFIVKFVKILTAVKVSRCYFYDIM